MCDRHISAIPHWIKKDLGYVEYSAVCNKCGFDWVWSEIKYFNYCPNCGVKMREDNQYCTDAERKIDEELDIQR